VVLMRAASAGRVARRVIVGELLEALSDLCHVNARGGYVMFMSCGDNDTTCFPVPADTDHHRLSVRREHFHPARQRFVIQSCSVTICVVACDTNHSCSVMIRVWVPFGALVFGSLAR
jgi:phosphoenolpyruvate-protein kinase (PTS system EI component)